MALQDIFHKISDEAKKKSSFMKQVTDDEIKKVEEEAAVKANVRKEEIEGKVKTQSVSIIEKSKTLAKMEGRSQTLRQKREVIDQTYEETEKELNALSAHDYVKLMADMLKEAKATAEKGSLTIPEGRDKEMKEAIEKAHSDFHIKSETTEFKGGFVITSGKIEINLSFPYLLQKIVRPSTELEVAKILFP